MPPETLGPYRLGDPLGKGGMGSVYRAVHRETGEAVAVKVLDPRLALTEGFRDRFEGEVGAIDILVNNAGMQHRTPLEDFPADTFEKLLQTNIASVFHVGQAVARHMIGRGEGKIIFTASLLTFQGGITVPGYAASKGGVAGLTLPLARDLAQHGVRVCTIAPGIFETPMLIGLGEKVMTSRGQQVPFPQRLGRPHEYAMLACAIAENPLLIGEVIRLDGAIRMAPR